jgi:hypothetical protein
MASTWDPASEPAPAAEPRHTRWPVVAGISITGAAFALLLRFAVDLLALISLLVLVNSWTRDALADWAAGRRFEDEPDPLWAVGAVGVGVFGSLLAVIWLAGTTPWGSQSRIAHYVPSLLTDAALWAETNGWGRRLVLPGGPVRAPERSAEGSPGGTPDQQVRRSPGPATPERPVATSGRSGGASSGAAGSTGSDAAGTAEAATTARLRERTGPAAIETSVALASSQPAARAGTPVRFTARVTAADARPTGAVVFRRGRTILASATVDQGGTATVSVSDLAVGEHVITAEFAGTGTFRRSRSSPLQQVIVP